MNQLSFENELVEVKDFRKKLLIILEESMGICLKLINTSQMITTCNRLDLETLGIWLIMPKNIPGHWPNVCWVCCIYIEVSHNITQRRGPSKYNNGMMGVQSKSKPPYIGFLASHCYILRAHRTRVARWVRRKRRNITSGNPTWIWARWPYHA